MKHFANLLCRRAMVPAILATSLGAHPPPARPPMPAPEDDPLRPGAEQVQRLLAERLPAGWTVTAPQPYLGVAQVVLQIPRGWRGNPISAAADLCPDPDSPIWQSDALAPAPGGDRLLRVIVRFDGRDQAPFDCRR